MSDNVRDAQFQNFARLLMNDLGDEGFIFEGEDNLDREEQLKCIETLIARRAYDFACHVSGEFVPKCEDSVEGYVARIPDMTELPKETS